MRKTKTFFSLLIILLLVACYHGEYVMQPVTAVTKVRRNGKIKTIYKANPHGDWSKDSLYRMIHVTVLGRKPKSLSDTTMPKYLPKKKRDITQHFRNINTRK